MIWVGVTHLFHAKIPHMAGEAAGALAPETAVDSPEYEREEPSVAVTATAWEVGVKAVLAVATLALGVSRHFSELSQHTMVNATDVQWKEAPVTPVGGDPVFMATQPKRACS